MKNWKKGFKSHKEMERAEEKTGIDYDKDDEAGEPEAHKEKVKEARWKKFKEWLIEREEKDVHDRPGGSNVGQERETSGPKEGPFCGPSGGAPAGSFPVTNKKQVRAAKAYARHAPNPSGIKSCADRIAKGKGWESKEEKED
jgi:hypothetical protein